ncbi:Rpn family recombination-promoting nuclease/putative transposase [uncultured Nostoc sp.]|uniref:Rpn family recombination-promoting nuclease/putative transposase n=1 Tax=uncultured Nostoc sp. TaxID=340711 RepID=UPI0035CA368D
MSFDNVCKLLAEKYPVDFVRWLIAEESPNVKVLKTELSLEPIRADFVTFLRTANRILHIEFQTLTQSNPAITFRMLDYSVRLKRQYKCPVVQVVIFLQETDDKIAFTEEYLDDTTIHRYRVVRMWEQDSGLFLNNVNLLPLATLSRTDSSQDLLSQVAEKVAKISDREIKQNIAGYTEILAGLRFDKTLIRQMLSEDIMQESVIYQDILQKGQEQGKQQEAFSLCMSLLEERFGEIDDSIYQKVKTLKIEQVEALCRALFRISEIDNLVAWLDEQQSI